MRVLFRVRILHYHRAKAWQKGIVASNHISLIDPPVVGFLFRREISFLAKSELFAVPVLGWVIRNLNSIPIRRGAIDRQATETVLKRLAAGGTMLIFPEGSRKNFTAKPGIGKIAIEAQAPVLPVLVRNSDKPLACMLGRRRLTLVVGEPIPLETVAGYPDTKEGYRALSEYILSCINALKDGETE